MLLWLSKHFASLAVFHYLTIRSIIAALVAMVSSIVCGPWMIRKLVAHQIGQMVRSNGPQAHLAKAGTPTMGGVLIIAAVLISVLFCADLSNSYIWLLIATVLSFGAIGFLDDYLKVSRSDFHGLSGRYKFMLQTAAAMIIAWLLWIGAKTPEETVLIVPFFKKVGWQLSYFFPAWVALVMVSSSNAANLTDGLDGLVIMPLVMIMAALGVFCYLSGHAEFANYLLIPYVSRAAEVAVFCSSVVGAGMGFLWFNTYPAQIIMGDVGPLGLGAVMGLIAVMVRQELVLVIMAGVMVVETLSVIFQVLSFRLFGRRIFKMAPLHHHFELSGWPEPRVIVRFWIITCVLVLFGLATLKIR